MMSSFTYGFCIMFISLTCVYCNNQYGPDPWHYKTNSVENEKDSDLSVPPDLKLPLVAVKKNKDESGNAGDWFFKRVLAIFLKGGKTENKGEDVEVSVQMRINSEHWKMLNEYISSPGGLTEDMYRRTVGYLEESIYKPNIVDKIVMAWADYGKIYLIYKVQIIYGLIFLIASITIFLLRDQITRTHIIISIFFILYFYEVIISYKEAEQQEYQKFVAAINLCSWYFWTSSCDVPPPDLLVFLHHMHPLKISVRLFTIIITEPVRTISSTVNEISTGITDGLWFPINRIVSGILIVFFSVMFMLLLVMVVFNFILNIPFNLSLFAGVVSFGVKQRKRTIIEEISPPRRNSGDGDRLSGVNLRRLLNIMDQNRSNVGLARINNDTQSTLRRSASTGRLADCTKLQLIQLQSQSGIKRRFELFQLGAGDS